MTQPPPDMPPGDRAQTPGTPEKKTALGDLGAPQPVFDTVIGPNLRLRDNLIQLVCVVAAVILTFLITLLITHELPMALVIGLVGGLIGGILISGAVLGIYRGLQGVNRMAKK